ncbi:sister chromatid separation protein Src1 [Zymoseptoria brevis]|uniref:Sister chromatid separation protein Src1 n=1 Tax=Zymoseptoria brevis TaxID=1047168 RepID=A0A0F4G4Z3_9PEZI|nr:sister chromatid separation protein Src1 [Zymoseptoria brevis]
MDDQEYLDPDFDPSSVTIPRLRSILVAHNVSYPSSAKKQQLVELFNTSVLPQVRKIRAANARVKRTSRGIEDITTGRKGTGARDESDDDIPPTPATGRSSRRTTRSRTEEPQEFEATPRNVRHSTAPPQSVPRTVSSKHARSTETLREEDEQPARRRSTSRRSRAEATPTRAKPAEDSPFSDQNVFQKSGGSPPAPQYPESERRRTTMSTTARDLERRARELRRRTDDVRQYRPQTDGAVVPSRKTFQVPIPKQQEIDPTEEFTPEEQQELVHAQQAGELVPARRPRPKPSTGIKQALSMILLVFSATTGGLWRQEKLAVGYCGVGRPSTDLAGVQVPEWAEAFRPQCEPCPPHAFCHENLETECENGFVLTHSPLALGGLVPIVPSCEPDSTRARKVAAVKDRAVEALRVQNAKYECGEASAPELQEQALKEAISTKRRKGMSNEEFEDLWASAVGDMARSDEIISGSDGSGHALLRSSSLAAVPLSCALRRSLRQSIRQYFWQLVGVFLVLSSGAYGRYQITSGHETERKAKQLASLALEKLSLQASLNAQDPDIYRDNYIPMAQLRDDVLRDEFSGTRRKKLWEKVQKKVEGNSNVRPMVREGRTGDVGRVWEWVGAVGLLESPAQGEREGRRKSGRQSRVSFAADALDSSLLEGEDSAVVRSDVKTKRWEEGRPYY